MIEAESEVFRTVIKAEMEVFRAAIPQSVLDVLAENNISVSQVRLPPISVFEGPWHH